MTKGCLHRVSVPKIAQHINYEWLLIMQLKPEPLHLCPLIADMSSDVMWYSGQSYPVIYRATRGLGLVKRLRCSYVFKQKYSFKGVGISGKFDQYFPVTDLRKTCCSHDHCEPDHWPLTSFSLKSYLSFVSAVWSRLCYSLNVEE